MSKFTQWIYNIFHSFLSKDKLEEIDKSINDLKVDNDNLKTSLLNLSQDFNHYHKLILDLQSAWKQQIPAILNALSTANSSLSSTPSDKRLDILDKNLAQLAARMDANLLDVRDKISFFYYRNSSNQSSNEIKILDLGSVVNTLKKNPKLHFGKNARSSYINISSTADKNIDIVADPRAILPFGENTIQSIIVTDGLQSVPSEIFTNEILPHWLSLLVSGGSIQIEIFNLQAALNTVASGQATVKEIEASIQSALSLNLPYLDIIEDIRKSLKDFDSIKFRTINHEKNKFLNIIEIGKFVE